MNQLLANISASSLTQIFAQAQSTFSMRDVADILIASFFIYLVFIFIKQTRSYFIFTALGGLIVVSYIASIFDLGLTRQLFQPVLTFFLIIFVIVFQREISRFFRWFTLSSYGFASTVATLNSEIADTIVSAVTSMAKAKMGSIIVLSGDYPLDDAIEGGFDLDGKVSAPLILSIFDHTTPGHDGAMIIENSRIKRFGVHLPLAEDFKGFATMGTRHRAAIGISERTDALAIVVSEERGTISIAEGGVLTNIEAGELDDHLRRFMKENETLSSQDDTVGFWRYMIAKNFYSKLAALGLAFVLWFVLVFQAGTTTAVFDINIEYRGIPEGLSVSKIVPSQIKTTVSGSNRDIQTLDPRLLHASVNLSDAKEGWKSFEINKDNLLYPSYVKIEKFTPEKIDILLTK